VSGCEDLPTFRDLTPSPSSGCAGGLVVPKLITRCPSLRGFLNKRGDVSYRYIRFENFDKIFPL